VPAKCQVSDESVSDREIRVLLGQRPRALYDVVQRLPMPDRFADLVEDLIQRLEAQERQPNAQALPRPQKIVSERNCAKASAYA
jgi:hypothetical protein